MNKILYAEDEVALGKIVLDSLESRGFTVKWVHRGDQVVSAYEEFQPDICVLDVMMPGKDGFMVDREPKRALKSAPVIFLTAKSETRDVLQGFESGGNDYIRKPFSIEELIIRINNLLSLEGKRQNEKGNIYLGEMKYDPESLQLTRGDVVVNLSHRENELLKYLHHHRKGIILRKDILTEIWGDDHYFHSRNLDVYIRKLRKYFEGDSTVQIITLKGVGYRFVLEHSEF